MSDVLDQSDTSSYVALTAAELQQAWDTHVRVTGAVPQPECEPSPEQLGALRARLRTGEPPAADFAVWGTFDRRHAKDRASMALVWVEGGGLQPRRLHGPGSFATWDLSWGVFTAAMVSLSAASPGSLLRYRNGVRDLNTLYPDLWGVVSRADQAMRFEQWTRMAFQAPTNGDWSLIIASSAFGEEGSRQVWWDRQVCKPAQSPRPHAVVNALEGYSPRGATLSLDGPGLEAVPTGPHAGVAALPPFKKQRRGGRGRGPKPTTDPVREDTAAAAAPADRPKSKAICYAFNIGACSLPCPRSFLHICSVCKAEHLACATPGCKEQIDATGRPKGKGAGKGGKGGKQ